MSILHDDNPEDSWNLRLTDVNLMSIILHDKQEQASFINPLPLVSTAALCGSVGETAGREPVSSKRLP